MSSSQTQPMNKLELTYEQLYKLYGSGQHEVPHPVTDELYIQTPDGYTKINKVVCKHNHELIRLDFDDNDSLECSTEHLLQDLNGDTVKAINAYKVNSVNGVKTVVEKTPLPIETVYDISIDSPHWYISKPESGLIHHNTYFALSVVKTFLEKYEDGGCIYFESESALRKDDFTNRNIDASRVVMLPVTTVQDFKTQAVRILDKYIETPEEQRKPLMFVLDSLGMLSTAKEVADASEGKDVRDMTRSQLIRGAFRVITLKLGQANVPLLVTNHTYDVIGCALQGTGIKTPNGNVDISEVKVGEYVDTMVGPKKVVNTYQYEFDEYYEVQLENGKVYNLTGEHKLMTQEGEWKKVSDLTEEDIVINIGN